MVSVASMDNTWDHSRSTNVREIKVMEQGIDHDTLDQALRRCGSTWDASQTHGLLSGRLAIAGADSGFEWLTQVLEGTDQADALRVECEGLLGALFASTYQQLAERLSAFMPLLPDDNDDPALRATALAHWCEGFLHGLVGGKHGADLRARLQAEPLADIIRDMLQITRAATDDESDAESDEEAYFELVEYVRVAAQLAFEELADLRQPADDLSVDALH
jgi:yecA family protein